MNFHINQKVVCIRDDWITFRSHEYKSNLPDGILIPGGPKKDSIYVIDGFNELGDIKLVGIEVKFKIEGISVRILHWSRDSFRPLEERKKSTETGMEILRAIARTTKIPRPIKKKETA